MFVFIFIIICGIGLLVFSFILKQKETEHNQYLLQPQNQLDIFETLDDFTVTQKYIPLNLLGDEVPSIAYDEHRKQIAIIYDTNRKFVIDSKDIMKCKLELNNYKTRNSQSNRSGSSVGYKGVRSSSGSRNYSSVQNTINNNITLKISTKNLSHPIHYVVFSNKDYNTTSTFYQKTIAYAEQWENIINILKC